MSTPNPENHNTEGQQPPAHYGQESQRPEPRYGQYAPRQEQGGEQGTPGGQGQSWYGQSSQQPAGSPQSGATGSDPYGQQPNWGQSGGAGSYGSSPYSPQGTQHGGQPASSPGQGAGSSPYGGSPYGQPGQSVQPSGAYQPPSGASYGGSAPSYPGYGNTPTEKPKRPGTMLASMFLMLGAGLTSLLWGIFFIASYRGDDLPGIFRTAEMEEQAAEEIASDPALEGMTVEEFFDVMAIMFGVIALIWAFVLLAVYITFSLVGTMTGNVGRILATIWAGLSIFFLVPLFYFNAGTIIMVILTVLLSLGALALLWLKPSSDYIEARREYKDRARLS